MRRVSVLAAAVALIAFALAPWGTAPEPAYAGPPEAAVLDWNLNAINALVNAPTAAIPGAGQTPPVSMLHLAMVQGAVYDAVNMIDAGHEPYLAGLPPAPASASKAAAVATAAHHVLVGVVIVPALSAAIVAHLDDLYAASLAAAVAKDGASAVSAGIAAGAAAAGRMLVARAHDGRYPAVPFSFTVGDDAGEWRPTSGVNDPFAWVVKVDPFLLKTAAQVRTKGPHALTSGAYPKEYNEVKAYGGNGTTTPSLRTSEQTATALFFAVNPMELFNRTFRGIADAKGLSVAEEARLFAMLSMAGADALIGCWDDKVFWSYWRPVPSTWATMTATPGLPGIQAGRRCSPPRLTRTIPRGTTV